MKTETSPLLASSTSSLKVIETTAKDKAHLRVLKGEEATTKQTFSFFTNDSINDVSNWDASWFASYE